jgi:hypothetical protein
MRLKRLKPVRVSNDKVEGKLGWLLGWCSHRNNSRLTGTVFAVHPLVVLRKVLLEGLLGTQRLIVLLEQLSHTGSARQTATVNGTELLIFVESDHGPLQIAKLLLSDSLESSAVLIVAVLHLAYLRNQLQHRQIAGGGVGWNLSHLSKTIFNHILELVSDLRSLLVSHFLALYTRVKYLKSSKKSRVQEESAPTMTEAIKLIHGSRLGSEKLRALQKKKFEASLGIGRLNPIPEMAMVNPYTQKHDWNTLLSAKPVRTHIGTMDWLGLALEDDPFKDDDEGPPLPPWNGGYQLRAHYSKEELADAQSDAGRGPSIHMREGGRDVNIDRHSEISWDTQSLRTPSGSRAPSPALSPAPLSEAGSEAKQEQGLVKSFLFTPPGNRSPVKRAAKAVASGAEAAVSKIAAGVGAAAGAGASAL